MKLLFTLLSIIIDKLLLPMLFRGKVVVTNKMFILLLIIALWYILIITKYC
jgi:hypothetical protein